MSAQELDIAQPHHLVAAEHRDRQQGLHGRRADLERRIGIVGNAIDRLVREAVVDATGEFIVQVQGLLAHRALVAADDRKKFPAGFDGCFALAATPDS